MCVCVCGMTYVRCVCMHGVDVEEFVGYGKEQNEPKKSVCLLLLSF